MIPDFLKDFEEDLKKYEREFVQIKAIPKKEKLLEDTLGLKESKFLGKPFFPKKNEYPKDKNKKPMIMVAQLNFEQIPYIEPFPRDGILQLFLSSTDWYDEDYIIVYHTKEELNELPMDDFSFLKEEYYEESPVFKIHQLLFEKAIDKGGSEDSQFDYLFNGNDYWDFTEKLTEEQEELFVNYFDASGHKIAGYAEFTQYDPREDNNEQNKDIQILQIDVDDYIMFGDSGVAHIFISKENLIKKDFSKAYFYWDCC
ncbi:YwqG family protein [Tenacibaculum sp. TC6]|uniref:YwqG family protein n=1 Tax=Tenacibaculum sp. TC6 TaxID=3423223 RepID=UPI003D35A733